MTTKIKALAAATVFALMATSTAFAGEIEIGGNALNVGVVNGAATNTAGFLAKADSIVGWPLEESELVEKLDELFDKLETKPEPA